MENPLPYEVEQHLHNLQSPDAARRLQAAEALGRQTPAGASVLEALKAAARADTDPEVRRGAETALVQLGHPLEAAPASAGEARTTVNQPQSSGTDYTGVNLLGGLCGAFAGFLVIRLVFAGIFQGDFANSSVFTAMLGMIAGAGALGGVFGASRVKPPYWSAPIDSGTILKKLVVAAVAGGILGPVGLLLGALILVLTIMG